MRNCLLWGEPGTGKSPWPAPSPSTVPPRNRHALMLIDEVESLLGAHDSHQEYENANILNALLEVLDSCANDQPYARIYTVGTITHRAFLDSAATNGFKFD